MKLLLCLFLLVMVSCNSKNKVENVIQPIELQEEETKLGIEVQSQESNKFRGSHVDLQIFEIQDQYEDAALFKSGNGYPFVIIKKDTKEVKALIHSIKAGGTLGISFVAYPLGWDTYMGRGPFPVYELIQMCVGYKDKKCKPIDQI